MPNESRKVEHPDIVLISRAFEDWPGYCLNENDERWAPVRQTFEGGYRAGFAAALASHAPTPAPTRNIDGKFSMKYGVSGGQIINTVSGEAIPEDEPLFLLRARDHNAYDALLHYLSLCKADGCNDLHLAGIRQNVEKFIEFRQAHPERMKQPGITKHLQLEAPSPPQAEPPDLVKTLAAIHQRATDIYRWHAAPPELIRIIEEVIHLSAEALSSLPSAPIRDKESGK